MDPFIHCRRHCKDQVSRLGHDHLNVWKVGQCNEIMIFKFLTNQVLLDQRKRKRSFFSISQSVSK